MGRKRFYLASYLLFTIGSILAGTSNSLSEMIVYRIIQGAGGGPLIPISQAILRETYPQRQQGKAMARKSNLDTFLPLIRALHVHEEAGREGFWLGVGLPNYLKLAADLHELFLNSQDPTWFLEDAQSRVDREYVRLLLEGPDF